jgi:hypothetical protein
MNAALGSSRLQAVLAIARRDLLEFVAATQRAALTLGSSSLFEPNLIASRPVESPNVNGANRQ